MFDTYVMNLLISCALSAYLVVISIKIYLRHRKNILTRPKFINEQIVNIVSSKEKGVILNIKRNNVTILYEVALFNECGKIVTLRESEIELAAE